MKHLLIILSLLTLSISLYAQPGNGGAPIAEAEEELYCWNNGGSLTTIRVINWYTPGTNTAVATYYLDLSNNPVTPNLADLNPGSCISAGTGLADTVDYEYISTLMCDITNDTSFIRLIEIEKIGGQTATTTVLGNFGYDWTVYTPSSAVNWGPCQSGDPYVNTQYTVIREEKVAPGSLSGIFTGYEICNTGFSNGTITVTGVTSTLKPGECWSCSAVDDPTDREFVLCPGFSYDASGTTFILTYSSLP